MGGWFFPMGLSLFGRCGIWYSSTYVIKLQFSSSFSIFPFFCLCPFDPCKYLSKIRFLFLSFWDSLEKKPHFQHFFVGFSWFFFCFLGNFSILVCFFQLGSPEFGLKRKYFWESDFGCWELLLCIWREKLLIHFSPKSWIDAQSLLDCARVL